MNFGNQKGDRKIFGTLRGKQKNFTDPINLKSQNINFYYALNKILNSDWLNTNLTLVDVWLAGSNVRQRNLMSGQ